MGSRWKRMMMQIARSVLAQQQNIVANQVLAEIEEMVIEHMKSYVQEVIGGAWTGRAADTFVESVTNEGLGTAGQVVGHVTNFGTNINKSLEIMEEADNAARTLVNNLDDVFQGIY